MADVVVAVARNIIEPFGLYFVLYNICWLHAGRYCVFVSCFNTVFSLLLLLFLVFLQFTVCDSISLGTSAR